MSTETLRLYEIRSLSGLEKIQESWKYLVNSAENVTPFQTWEWNYGLARFEDRQVRLRIIVGENAQGEVVGIAPFWIRFQPWLRLPILEFIGSHPSDHLDLLCLERYHAAFVSRILEWIEHNTEWRILNLVNLNSHSAELINSRGLSEVRVLETCAHIHLPGSMEEYEHRMLQKRLGRTIRQFLKLLAPQGRLSFSLSRTNAELEKDLPNLFVLHQLRQRAKGQRGRFINEDWRRTILEMSHDLLQAGHLRLGTLRIDGKPAASLYDLRIRDREYACFIGMDPAMGQFHPGSLLYHWMIGEAIKDGMKLYDFGRGDESYKSRWTKDTYEIFQITRARSHVEALVWRQWESWRNKVYKSQLVKRLYHMTVGRFQHSE